MTEYYSHTGNKIIIGHFPGQTKPLNIEFIDELKERKFDKPDNLDIISVITKDKIESSPLDYQLKLNEYEYINPLKIRNMIWRAEKKPFYVLEGLKESDKEYSLVLDGNDSVILSDLTDIASIFETYGKKVLYNATIWMFPHTIIDNVKDRGAYGRYCYLNAGCCFGKTDDLIDFYEKITAYITKNPLSSDSEQYYVRKVFNKNQDSVFFDYDCKIFQCWHKAQYTYETDNETGNTICKLL